MNRLAMLIALMLFASSAATAEDCGLPLPGTEMGYVVKSEASAPETGCGLVRQIEKTQVNPHAVLVLRHGALIFERYGGGWDQPWGGPPGPYQYGAEDIHDVRSVSKSVVSLLIGIALDRGLIKNLDQSIFNSLPGYEDLATPDSRKISPRMLLTMTSGFHTNEQLPYTHPNNTERLMAIAADPYRSVLERKLTAIPGARWAYSGGDTMLLSRILQNASGQTLTAFAEDNLFKPLGITTYRWMALKASGETAAYGGLKLRPRDMAKLGLLVLQQGRYDGKQIVSQEWIKTSTAPQQDAWFPYQYAMHWWSSDLMPDAPQKQRLIIALGIGGQRIVVVPDMDTVVVITAGMYDDPDQMRKVGSLVTDIILPAIDRF
jgi:CubicO group peptidase (beta-lactamase class C family)